MIPGLSAGEQWSRNEYPKSNSCLLLWGILLSFLCYYYWGRAFLDDDNDNNTKANVGSSLSALSATRSVDLWSGEQWT
jgi:hypothetical protein